MIHGPDAWTLPATCYPTGTPAVQSVIEEFLDNAAGGIWASGSVAAAGRGGGTATLTASAPLTVPAASVSPEVQQQQQVGAEAAGVRRLPFSAVVPLSHKPIHALCFPRLYPLPPYCRQYGGSCSLLLTTALG